MKNNDIDIINNNEKIKSFIKLEFSEIQKKDIYEIDKSKKYITIYNLETKDDIIEKKSYNFEFDKIFTNNDSNSYIYEEICLNCIKQSFEGISFNFISFGETNSNKFNLLFGKIKEDYNNINNHGIFIRYLKDLFDKNKKYNYNIKLSSLLIYEDILLDLFNIIDINNNKNNKENLDFNDFIKNSIKIEKDINIINKITKSEYYNDDINKIIIFLHELINILIKLENDGNNYLYSLSHVCFIIYLFDKENKIITSSSFILLNGCEHVYDIKKKNIDIKEKNNMNDHLINSINVQTTYDSIINCIKFNKYIISSKNKNIENNDIKRKSLDKNKLKDKKEKKLLPSKDEILNEDISKYSKLIVVLYSICFNPNIKNINFRIIGNIKPTPDYFIMTRDTLLFCSNCFKILDTNDKLSSEKFIKKNNLDDLNFQIKLHLNKIDSLNHQLEKKEDQINFLSKNYNAQINAIKKYFDFDGDPNEIIFGNYNPEEENYFQNLKYKIRRQEKEIKKYKSKLEESKNELIKYKNIASVKSNDDMMLTYYSSILNNQKKTKSEIDLMNSLNKEIIELKQKINTKDKIIEKLQQDLNEKNNILCKLHQNLNIKVKNNKKKNEKIKEESKNLINESNIILKNEIEKLKRNERKNIQAISDEYNFELNEKKNIIFMMKKKLEGTERTYQNEIEIINKELVQLYEIILNLITGYQNIFVRDNYEELKIDIKRKEDFDKLIFHIEREVSDYNFCSLYNELKKQNKTKQSIIESLTKKNLNKINRIINNFDSNNETIKNRKIEISEKEMEIKNLNNKLLSMSHYLKDQVQKNNTNNIIIKSQKSTIEKMQKNALLYEHLLKNKIKEKSNRNFHSPTFTNSKIIKKSILRDLNLSNNSTNKIYAESLNYTNNISKIKDSEIYNTSMINQNKKTNFTNKTKFIKKVNFIQKNYMRPFSSDTKNDN